MNTLENLKELVDLLEEIRPPRVEVWVRDYIPSGKVFEIVLKDLPTLSYTNLPGTEVIYLMNTNDFSTIGISEILCTAGIPVFDPSGERLG